MRCAGGDVDDASPEGSDPGATTTDQPAAAIASAFIESMTRSPKHMLPISPLFVWVSNSPGSFPGVVDADEAAADGDEQLARPVRRRLARRQA